MWRYRSFTIRNSGDLPDKHALLRLRFRAPVRADVVIREYGSDQHTLREIFFDEVYGGIQKYIADCRTVIDLGANIGLATVYFSGIFPESKALSVEPASANFTVLRRNTEALARKGRCRALQAAIWNEDCGLDLNDVTDGAYWGFQLKTPEVPGKGLTPGLSMASIIDQSGFETVDLVKVDVEGAEVQLFQGDLGWLPRVRAMAVEFHGDSRAESRFDSIMSGYRITDLNSHTVLAYR